MYGPLTDQVERLVVMAERLDSEIVAEIAAAYKEHRFPHARFVLIAAKKADRWEEVFQAGRAMSLTVTSLALLNGWDQIDVRYVAWAAMNAGVALATEDLIGTMGYSLVEYANLVDPWFAGFPIDEREIAV